MALKDNASLALIPAAYKTSKVYSAIPTNGDGDFTFSRSGTGATRINKAGLVETMGTNVPRLNYDLTNGTPASCPSLLLEPTRTNNLLRSEEFDNSVWTKFSAGTGTNPVATANYTTSPDGSNNADRVIFDKGSGTGGSDLSQMRQVVTDVGQGVSSVYIKSNTSESYTMGIDPVGNATLITVTPEWQRFTYSETTNDRLSIGLRGSQTSNFADVSVWGAQMEAGTYATSYIPTTTAAVTSTADNAHLLNQNLITDYPFTAYANAKIDAVGNTIFSLNNTSNQNYYLAFYFPNSTQIGLLRRDLSNSDSDFYNFSYSVGDTIKVAVAFISATAYKLYINGTEIADVTSGASIPFNHDDITLGQFRITGDTGTRNRVDEFMLFNEALTDAELQTLTT